MTGYQDISGYNSTSFNQTAYIAMLVNVTGVQPSSVHILSVADEVGRRRILGISVRVTYSIMTPASSAQTVAAAIVSITLVEIQFYLPQTTDVHTSQPVVSQQGTSPVVSNDGSTAVFWGLVSGAITIAVLLVALSLYCVVRVRRRRRVSKPRK